MHPALSDSDQLSHPLPCSDASRGLSWETPSSCQRGGGSEATLSPPELVHDPLPPSPGPYGKEHWEADFPDCGGTAQSPIDIQTGATWHDPSLLPVLPLGYGSLWDDTFTLHNNGHTGEKGTSQGGPAGLDPCCLPFPSQPPSRDSPIAPQPL